MHKKRVSIAETRSGRGSPMGAMPITDYTSGPQKILKKGASILSPPPLRSRSNLKGSKKRLTVQTNQIHYNKYSNLEESKIC